MKLKKMLAVAYAACLGAIGLAGCMPQSVTLNFGPRDMSLVRTVVGSVGGDRNADAKVAMIDVRGLIVDSTGGGLLEAAAGTSPVDDLAAALEKAEREKDVRAIVLRINSPGGSVTASDQMYRMVMSFKERTGKPVVASFGEVAASGGYYLAMAADEIIAEPTTITASIGVIIPTVNISGGLSRIGVVSRSVKSGANKDLGNPLEPIRESQYAVLQDMVNEYYARFRGLVLERRKVDPSRIADLTDGRIVTGAEAVRTGLADREGGIQESLERACALANVEKAAVIKYHVRDAIKPRTVYAVPAASTPAHAPAATAGASDEIVRRLWPMATLEPGRAYYVLVP